MAIKDLKSLTLAVRLTESEYKTLEALAEEEERTLSDTARRVIKKGLETYQN